MSKYIDSDRLRAKINKRMTENREFAEKCVLLRTYECFSNRASEDNDILAIINSLQQEQPIIEEDLVEKRKQECGYRRLSANGNYQCEKYEGVFGPCDGRCSWIVDYPKLKELKERKPEVDLDEEVQRWKNKHGVVGMDDLWLKFAHHFYELKLNIRKEE